MPRIAALVALTLVAVACGAPEDSAPASTPPPTPVPTLGGVGQLPDTVPADREPLVLVTRPPIEEPDAERNNSAEPEEPVAEQIEGNRILVIGDSIMASTSSRYGGAMCAALVPLGWAVAVDAEPGRFVDFGLEVLDERLDPATSEEEEWDAAAVHLGSNYRGDPDDYARQLEEILTRLAPRPTILFTVTQYKSEWAEVNEVVRAYAKEFDNVTLVDWEAISEIPGVLSGDGLHPGTKGIQVLVESTASAIGPHTDSEGECLDTSFTDDTAINEGSTPAPPSGGSTSGSTGGSTGGSSGGTSNTPTATAPPPDPPAIDPPPPDPPATDPPPPDPPATDPPPPDPPATDPPVIDPPPTDPSDES